MTSVPTYPTPAVEGSSVTEPPAPDISFKGTVLVEKKQRWPHQPYQYVKRDKAVVKKTLLAHTEQLKNYCCKGHFLANSTGPKLDCIALAKRANSIVSVLWWKIT